MYPFFDRRPRFSLHTLEVVAVRTDQTSSSETPKYLLVSLLLIVVLAGFSLAAIAETTVKPGGPFQ